MKKTYIKLTKKIVYMIILNSYCFSSAMYRELNSVDDNLWEVKEYKKPLFFKKGVYLKDINPYINSTKSVTNPKSLISGELVITYSKPEKSYFFAEFQGVSENQLILKKYDPEGFEQDIHIPLETDGTISKELVFRLNALWQWINKPVASYSSFFPTIEDFKNIPEYKISTPNFKGILINPDELIIAIGDIHGDHLSLASNILDLQRQNIINNEGKLNEKYHIIFTGDITGRGEWGIECWYILLKLAILNPGKVHIIRGNHENHDMALNQDSFYNEFFSKISPEPADWEKMKSLWDHLPLAFFVTTTYPLIKSTHFDFLIFSHGSINIERNYNEFMKEVISKKNIIVSQKIDEKSWDCDFTWGDFDAFKDTSKTSPEENIKDGGRGAGEHVMNLQAFRSFCTNIYTQSEKLFKLSGLIRGHQHVPLKPCENIGMLTQNDNAPWQGLKTEQAYKLDCSVCTIISAPNVETVGCAPNNAYAIIKPIINLEDQKIYWHIIPKRPKDNAY